MLDTKRVAEYMAIVVLVIVAVFTVCHDSVNLTPSLKNCFFLSIPQCKMQVVL